MYHGRNDPMVTLPVERINAAPVGQFSCASRGGWKRQGDERGLPTLTIAKRALPVLSQLAHLETDVVELALDVGTPRIERRDGLLERLDALLLRRPLGVEAIEALAQLLLLLGEALRHLVEDKLGVGVHGTVAALKPGEVVVSGLMLQDRMNLHKSSRRGRELRDP